jgi:uncharacterized protein YabN with tetrapyrrole methylase and pyrophosphatase domain
MKSIDTLKQTISTLKGPKGCAWDQNQVLGNYARYFQEEVTEVIAAIDSNDWVNLKEELSDVLSLIVSVCQMAQESDHFDLDAVAQAANAKLIRRLPHIFSEHPQVLTEAEVYTQWQRIKAEEKAEKASVPVNDVPSFLKHSGTALYMAQDLCQHLKNLSTQADPLLKIQTLQIKDLGTSEAGTEHALGKALFECVAAAQHTGLDPEKALRAYVYQMSKHLGHRDLKV